jgi:hypothetical protein
MATFIYSLCVFTAVLCAVLLLQAYGKGRYRLLLWSGLCFAGLAVNNVLLVIDKLILPTEIDLSTLRSSVSLLSMMVLLYGLIWDKD